MLFMSASFLGLTVPFRINTLCYNSSDKLIRPLNSYFVRHLVVDGVFEREWQVVEERDGRKEHDAVDVSDVLVVVYEYGHALSIDDHL